MILQSGETQIYLTSAQINECATYANMVSELGSQRRIMVSCEPETLCHLGDWFDQRLDWPELTQQQLLRLVALADDLWNEALLAACRKEFSRRVNASQFVPDGFVPWESAEEAQEHIDALPSWLDKDRLMQCVYKSLGA